MSREFDTDHEAAERAGRDEAQGQSPSTQAGEFVREEMHHIREGKHGARSPQQAIAIGLSKARRAGVKLPPTRSGKTSIKTRTQARRDLKRGGSARRRRPSRARSRATAGALKRERRSSASRGSLSRQARRQSRQRGAAARHRAAMKAARTRRRARLQKAARRAAQARRSKLPPPPGYSIITREASRCRQRSGKVR
jgi:Family of unknown function (DUF6496)